MSIITKLKMPRKRKPIESSDSESEYSSSDDDNEFGSSPYLMMPYGPPGHYFENGPEGEASSAPPPSSSFGMYLHDMNEEGDHFRNVNSFGNSLGNSFGNSFGSPMDSKYVNPSGYLATWYGQPVVPPPSWNPLLLQGNNVFEQNINYPSLSKVVPNSNNNSFGYRLRGVEYSRKPSKRVTRGRKSARGRKSTRGRRR